MTAPPKRLLGAIAATLILSSCIGTPSEVDPEARIDIAGRVARADGGAVSGVRVALTREADIGEVFSVFATLGLACIDAHTDVCLGSRVTRTGSDGRFAYVLKGRDTQGFAGGASTMVLTSGAGPRADDEVAGPITTYRFQVQTEALDIPLRLWEPRLDGRTGAFGARVAWTRVPQTALPGLNVGTVAYAIEFRRGTEIVWTVENARSGFAFDARLLEDTAGTASVTAEAGDQRVTDVRGRAIDVVLRSGARAYDSPGTAPPSRGASCSVAEESGRLVVQSPCRLTDGDFDDGFSPSVCAGRTGCSEPPHTSAVIDLGGRMPLSLIVVRGCGSRCTVETSRNTESWRTAGVASKEDVALRLNPQVQARYVRVTTDRSAIDDLREVSAWTGSGGVPPGPLFVEPGAITVLPPGATASPGVVALPEDGDEGNTLWRLVALGALCAVVGGLVATLLGRRKHASSRS